MENLLAMLPTEGITLNWDYTQLTDRGSGLPSLSSWLSRREKGLFIHMQNLRKSSSKLKAKLSYSGPKWLR